MRQNNNIITYLVILIVFSYGCITKDSRQSNKLDDNKLKFVIDNKSYKIIDKSDMKRLLKIAKELTVAIVERRPKIFAKYVTGYFCVDTQVGIKKLKSSIMEIGSFEYDIVFEPNWKIKHFKQDKKKNKQELDGFQHVGFAESLYKYKNQTVKVYASEFKYDDNKKSWIEGFVEFKSTHQLPFGRTALQFVYDKKNRSWLLTGHNWHCLD